MNDAPVATADTLTVAEDAAATALDVIANDTDEDGDTLSVTAVGRAGNGTAALVPGSRTEVTYRPDADFNGSDSFTYTVADGNGGIATGTVNVTVAAMNDSPVATADTLTVAEDAAATALDVLANDTDKDGDTLSVTAVGQAGNGTSSVTSGSTTDVTYRPDADFNGTDSFTYTVADGNGGIATGTVNVTVAAVNDAPVATADTLTVAEDAAATALDVLANDTDKDGDTLRVTAVGQAGNGTSSVTSGSTTDVTYRPDADFNGSDSFTYTVVDGNGGAATGTVNVAVAAVNDPPGFDEGVGTTRTVLKNAGVGAAVGGPVTARDRDGDLLEYSLLGTDRALFDVDHATGQLTIGALLDYGVRNEYSVRVQVEDGRGGVDVIDVVVVVDVDEPPSQPGALEVRRTGPTSLMVSWTAPDTGGREIIGYDVRYREVGGVFRDAGHDGVGTSVILRDLRLGIGYEVQVRAVTAEGAGPWSELVRDDAEPTATPDPTSTEPAVTAAPTPTSTVAPSDEGGTDWWLIPFFAAAVAIALGLINFGIRTLRTGRMLDEGG